MCRRNRIIRLSVLLLGLLVAASACGNAAVGPLPVVAGSYPVRRLLSTLCPPPAVHTVTGFAGGGQILGYQPGWGILVGANHHGGPGAHSQYQPGLYLVNAASGAVTRLTALALANGQNVQAVIGDGWVVWLKAAPAGVGPWSLQALNLATHRQLTVDRGTATTHPFAAQFGPQGLTIIGGKLYFLLVTPERSAVLAYDFATSNLRTVLALPAKGGRQILTMAATASGLTYVVTTAASVGGVAAGEVYSLPFASGQSIPLLKQKNAAYALAVDGSTLALALDNPSSSFQRALPYSSIVLFRPGATALIDVAIMPAIRGTPQFWSHYLVWGAGPDRGGVLDLATNQVYLLPNIGFFFNLGVYNGILGWTGALFKPAPTGSTAAVTVVQDITWCSLAD
ncbi:MAG: hypothetical protein ACYCO4_05975 [Sulfobacillus sp.]